MNPRTQRGALSTAQLDTWEDLHDAQKVLHCGAALAPASGDVGAEAGDAGCVPGDSVEGEPILRIGEGAVSYPFPSLPYCYQPRRFDGSLYYLDDCLTDAPSAVPSSTSIPTASSAPSGEPTVAETAPPSESPAPTPPPKVDPMPTALSYVDARSYGCHSHVSTDRRYGTFQKRAPSRPPTAYCSRSRPTWTTRTACG
mmetsp:Transcript_19812/g.42506  ORF Transcript_19812/g.42506 Transcript_19812/m.42506 type:complete len:198 (-) Transcript_19812:77-670(-)